MKPSIFCYRIFSEYTILCLCDFISLFCSYFLAPNVAFIPRTEDCWIRTFCGFCRTICGFLKESSYGPYVAFILHLEPAKPYYTSLQKTFCSSAPFVAFDSSQLHHTGPFASHPVFLLCLVTSRFFIIPVAPDVPESQ